MSENPQNIELSDSQPISGRLSHNEYRVDLVTSRMTHINAPDAAVYVEEPVRGYLAKLKRSAEEKDDLILFLRPPKMAKNEYMEQTPAKYVFQCSDGEIQIPEYGLLRTDFYYQERINILAVTNCDSKIIKAKSNNQN